VKPLFAEAKIVNGIGDPEKWAALLEPDAFRALRDRVDLDFAPTNPARLAPGDEVSVELFVKNAPKVMVKIYEINLLSFFLTQQRQLNTDLKLDGLLANREESHEFADPPLRRVARTFKFPDLKGRRGAWVVELIGRRQSEPRADPQRAMAFAAADRPRGGHAHRARRSASAGEGRRGVARWTQVHCR
jgi:hypothetical protein